MLFLRSDSRGNYERPPKMQLAWWSPVFVKYEVCFYDFIKNFI